MKAALAYLARQFRSPLDQAKADVTRRTSDGTEHHWSFERFPGWTGTVTRGFYPGYLGDICSSNFVDFGPCEGGDFAMSPPPIDEEYFELTDILEAAISARGTFTFLEIGAGWGRWSVRAALAARRLSKGVRLGLVEADPGHVAMILQHMADNNIPPSGYRVFEAAIAGEFGESAFTVSNPREDAAMWYGQAMVGAVIENHPLIGEYFGKPKHQLRGGGCEVVTVPTIPLSAVLADYPFVDLIDMDIQGAEADAINEAIGPLTSKTRRLHIGTHSPGIEDALRATLSSADWVCLRDYPGNQQVHTDFGPVHFVDGVQTWVNPRLL